MDEYYRAIRLLPSWLAGPLGQLPAQTAAQIHELRFRTGCGVFVTLSGRQLPLQDLPECPLGDLERRLAQIDQELSGQEQPRNQEEVMDKARELLELKTLPRELAVMLIEKIEVGEQDPDTGQQEVKIHWKF